MIEFPDEPPQRDHTKPMLVSNSRECPHCGNDDTEELNSLPLLSTMFCGCCGKLFRWIKGLTQ